MSEVASVVQPLDLFSSFARPTACGQRLVEVLKRPGFDAHARDLFADAIAYGGLFQAHTTVELAKVL